MNTRACELKLGGLRELLAGRLSGEQAASLESHLLECETCMEQFKKLESADSLFRSIESRSGVDHFEPHRVSRSRI